MKKKSLWIVVLLVLCCVAGMAFVDAVIRPGYAGKSAIKMALFLLLPLIASRMDRSILCFSLLKVKRKGLWVALIFGVGIYVLIVGAYFLMGPLFDFSGIAQSLLKDVGVTGANFLFVSLYISFVNSFLEEFFFRGFVFSNLKSRSGRGVAYFFSALVFSLYHLPMMLGWFSPLLFVLVMVGLFAGGMIFNFLNEKTETIYASWLTHMFANFAINTIGFILLT